MDRKEVCRMKLAQELVTLHDRLVAEYNETGNRDLLDWIAELEILLIAWQKPQEDAA
jgi:hypothetical protein